MTPTQKPAGTALAIMAQRVAVAPAELQQTLMATAFKGATPAEFMMLVAVANKYDLDPFVREIYAFPKKGGGIVPLVPIDGWLKLIRNSRDFAGMDVAWSENMVTPAATARPCPEWVEVTIHHTSTPEHPTVHREWIDEMYRETGPWATTTKRMLEWKGIIQAGRIAFGLSGIYDQDEAERISEGEVVEGHVIEAELVGDKDWKVLVGKAAKLGYSQDDILANAGALNYEGPGADMPRDIANTIYQAMKAAPVSPTDPDDNGGGKGKAAKPAPTTQSDAAASPGIETPTDTTDAQDDGAFEIDETPGSELDGIPEDEAKMLAEMGDTATAIDVPRPKAGKRQLTMIAGLIDKAGIFPNEEAGYLDSLYGVQRREDLTAEQAEAYIGFLHSEQQALAAS